jgi:hypothetical protein
MECHITVWHHMYGMGFQLNTIGGNFAHRVAMHDSVEGRPTSTG